MLKLVVSALSLSAASALRPEPDLRELSRPLPSRGRPAPPRENPELLGPLESLGPRPPLPPADPKPRRPAAPQMPAAELAEGNVLVKPKPLVPGQHSHGLIRALHGDHHDHDDHHDQDHMIPPAMGHPGLMRPFPSPPGGPGPKPPPGMKPAPKAKPTTASVFGKTMAAPPGMKPKPGPKPKPSPASVLGKPLPSSARMDIQMLADDAHQQCQMDYARLCAPLRSPFSVSGGFMGQSNGMDMRSSPQDSFLMDVLVFDEPVGVAPSKPCDADDADDDDVDDDDDDTYDDDSDDTYDDDSSETVIFSGPLLDVVQNIFSGLRMARPVPLTAMPTTLPAPPRMLWMKDYEEVDSDSRKTLQLGYGAEGDMCLLNNVERLSTSCQNSIDDLQVMVEDYDMDEEGGCHLMPIILLLLLLSLLLRCASKARQARRQDSLQTTLAAIHASPELKAKVEAASGVPLPPTLPACRAGMAMSQQPCYVKALCLLGVFLVSFIIVANAMLVTGLVVNGLYDDEQDPSPLVVLGLLFCVLTLQVLLVKMLRAAICSYLNSPGTPVTASSGTSASASQGSNSSGSSGGARSSLPEIFQRMRSVQVSSLLPASLSRSSSSSSGPQYEPLLSEEDYEQQQEQQQQGEMMMVPVQISASAPPAPRSSPVVITPVGYAQPTVRSSISML